MTSLPNQRFHRSVMSADKWDKPDGEGGRESINFKGTDRQNCGLTLSEDRTTVLRGNLRTGALDWATFEIQFHFSYVNTPRFVESPMPLRVQENLG